MSNGPVIEPRVRPGQLHHCGGTVHLKQGQHGRYLGCSNYDGGCRTRWNEHGWHPVTPRRLHATPTGLPATFVPERHPGDWVHHHMILPGKMPGDFSPVRPAHEGRLRLTLWAQWWEAVTRADRPRVADRSAERQLELS